MLTCKGCKNIVLCYLYEGTMSRSDRTKGVLELSFLSFFCIEYYINSIYAGGF